MLSAQTGEVYLLTARLNSAYHPDLLFKRHILVRNEKVQKLFIGQSKPGDGTLKNRKEYRNNWSVLGLLFYFMWGFVFAFSILFLCFGPQTPMEALEFDDGFYISALNQIVVFMTNLLLLGVGMSFYCLNILRTSSVKENKIIRSLWLVVVVFLFAICVAGVFEMVKMLCNRYLFCRVVF